ncbi:hypothetical protein E2I00_017821, partial [Balaenoptera physalus]
ENSGFKESGPAFSGASPGLRRLGCYVRASVPKQAFPAEKRVRYFVDSQVQANSLPGFKGGFAVLLARGLPQSLSILNSGRLRSTDLTWPGRDLDLTISHSFRKVQME